VAKVPTSTKPVTKRAASAKPAVAKPAAAKPVVVAAKPAPVAAPKPAVTVAAPAPKVELPKVEAPKAKAPKADAVTVVAAKPETKVETPAAAAPVAASAPMKGNTMNETITNAQASIKTAAEDMQTRATEMFGDMNTRAKDAMSKGTKAIEELVEFSKGNVEAIVASGRVAAKGAEEIAKYSAEYGRTTVEKANATAKQFAAVKSPTEFFQLQGEVAKQTLDALVAEGSKFTENYLKLVGEIAQPISNRVAVAAEKVKSTVAA
jgi:phasin family protein